MKWIIIVYLFIFMSCNFSSSTKDNSRKITDYYHGIVLNEQFEKVTGVSVMILEPGSHAVATDKEGHFEIKNKKFNKINIQLEKSIIFAKEGYITDTVSTLLIGPNYLGKKKSINNYFIHEIPDTIILRRKLF